MEFTREALKALGVTDEHALDAAADSRVHIHCRGADKSQRIGSYGGSDCGTERFRVVSQCRCDRGSHQPGYNGTDQGGQHYHEWICPIS